MDSCPACKIITDCVVSMLIGFAGGMVQVFRSKNYSFRIFASGISSSPFVALIACLLASSARWFDDRQGLILALCGVLGYMSNRCLDYWLPNLMDKFFRRAEKEIDK